MVAPARRPPYRSPVAGPLLGLLALSLLLACGPADSQPAPEAAVERPPPRPSFEAAAGLGRGFVVWESNRTGRWRLWTRRLDGGGLRQLSPDEAGRDHCCPHVSPDGSRIAYLSLPRQGREYPRSGVTGTLVVVGADGSGARRLGPARPYFEDRAVVWRSPSELVMIDGEGRTVLLDLEAGARRTLLAPADPSAGFLLDSTLTFATSGRAVRFAPYDASRRAVAERAAFGGCQPYFSQDGRWGFWTAGAGGPFYKIDLRTGVTSVLLHKRDPRLPAPWGYLYFPMLSPDGSLLAYAASDGAHDHFRSDYEVFVLPVDPETLEPRGAPVRYTFHPATDRYPTVFAAPLPLGRRRGEVPFRVRLAAGSGGDWEWNLGDGGTARGERIEYVYISPGAYRVTARSGDRVLEGLVVVAPRRPPAVEAVRLRSAGREVIVTFDEPVAAAGWRAELASGIGATGWSLSADGRELSGRLERRLERPDTLLLHDLADRARPPNVAALVRVPITPARWPAEPRGLLFLWQTADAPNLVPDPAGGPSRSWSLEPRGRAWLDHDFAMRLDGGAFEAPEAAARAVVEGAKNANELTLEVTLRPIETGATGPARILELAGGRTVDLALAQEGDALMLRLLVGHPQRSAAARRWVRLGRLEAGRTAHLLVSYAPGRLAAYLDGRRVLESADLQQDFFHWRQARLVFGRAVGGGKEWRGRLEGVALWARALGPEEAAENALRYAELRQARPSVPRLEVEARLVAVSAAPALAAISPYRQALAVFEYRVERVLAGRPPGDRLRVVHWSLLDGEVQPVHRLRPGERRRLVLEPFADNPQLEGVYLADTLEPAPDVPLWFAADG